MISLNEFLVKKHVEKSEYEGVDLGLPSGIKWASCNVGATKPEDPGLLFQWGRTDGYPYSYKKHKFLHKEEYLEEVYEKYKNGNILKLEDDAAHVSMKGSWRIPTQEEIHELLHETTNEIKIINNRKYKVFKSKHNDNYIMFPFIGYCTEYYGEFKYFNINNYAKIWSSNNIPNENSGKSAYYLNLNDNISQIDTEDIWNAYSIRGVCD